MSRKNRWVLEGKFPKGELEPIFVKVTNRPKESNDFLWENVKIQIFNENFANFFKIADKSNFIKSEKLKLSCYDWCGVLLETWDFQNAILNNFNFVEYGCDPCDPIDIEFTIAFESVDYKVHSIISTDIGFKYKTTCPNCKHEF